MTENPWKNLFDALENFAGPIERNQPTEPDKRDWTGEFAAKPYTLEQRQTFWRGWLESLSWEGELERNQPLEQQERVDWYFEPETDTKPGKDK